ncbi:MAG TPA: ANTAR domain-containing protein [Acidimicrobiia bacterium]|jgi:AmiR/NasT family two-component response regulator
MPDPSEGERIGNLEAAGRVQDERIAALETAGIAADERMVALATEIDGLHGKIEHRATIEQAKGVIMSAMGCGPEAAFAVLVSQSQAQNRKVSEIAAELAKAQNHRHGSN